MAKAMRVIISAGGTGGHLIPAQQLAKQLQDQYACEVLFVAKGLSKSVSFQKELFSYQDVFSSPLTFSPKGIFRFFFDLIRGTKKSFHVFSKFSPDVIIGFGSYHTFSPLLAAYCKKVPIILFESNALLGKINRFFAKKAKALALQFPLEEKISTPIFMIEALPWIEKKSEKRSERGIEKKTEKKPEEISEKISENKTFSKEQLSKKYQLDPNLFTFVVFGGSQGADFINKVFSDAAALLSLKKEKFQVIHLAGNEKKADDLQSLYNKLKIPCYVRGFEKNMLELLSIADFAVCRAGASSLSELLFFTLPALCIPYPFSSNGHQEKNGEFWQNIVRGGICQKEKEIKGFWLMQFLEKIQKKTELLVEWKKNIEDYQQKRKGVSLSRLVVEIGGKDGK
jgi:UDP-N-acetylglucosamine--N-acetylmuramyl-(pentapeptide) pyrophosphoryl-undecaprenol N-acetylglucosamine transferase